MNKELILPRIGAARNDLQYRLRTLIDSGALIAFGSDWPVTSEIPILALSVPVNRLAPGTRSETGWNISESITMEESLTFYIRNTAYQMFRDKERGSLSPGKKADFIVLEKSLFTIDPSEVSTIKVKRIYKNGVELR